MHILNLKKDRNWWKEATFVLLFIQKKKKNLIGYEQINCSRILIVSRRYCIGINKVGCIF